MIGNVLRAASKRRSSSVDPYFSNVTHLMPFDDNLNDYGSTTWNVESSVFYTQGKFGSAAKLDIYRPYSKADHDWWPVPYTIDAWVNVSTHSEQSANSRCPNMCGNAGASNYWSFYWAFGPMLNGQLGFHYYNGTPNYFVSANDVISLNTWHHIMFTNNAGTMCLYCDGYCVATATVVGTPQSSEWPERLNIGSVFNSKFIGVIDDFRITRGVARAVGSTVGVKYFNPPSTPAYHP